MEVQRLADGLWRWTARHPAWRSGADWGPDVASVYLETPEAVVLVDPAVPAGDDPDAAPFWAALDRDVARLARPVAVLLTRPRHARGAGAVVARYAGSVGARAWASRTAGQDALPSGVALERFAPEAALPGGIRAHPLEPVGGEVVYELPGRALAFGDAVVGTGGGRLGVWWVDQEPGDRERYERDLLPPLRALLAVRPAHVLPAHGPAPVRDAQVALRDALAAPPVAGPATSS